MMKTKLLFILLFFLIALPSYAFREQEKEKLALALEFGYGHLTEGTGGLTKNTYEYIRKLTYGFTWNGEIYYKPLRIVGVGILYTGYTSKASHQEGSDHIYTHYLAPQFGFTVLQLSKWKVRLQTGMGFITYYNNSKVFGKDRKVDGIALANNLGGSVEHKLSEFLGISLRFSYIDSHLPSSTIYYHDQVIVVQPGFLEKKINLSSINITLGTTFNF